MGRITYAKKANLNHISKQTVSDLMKVINNLAVDKKEINLNDYSKDRVLSILDSLEILDDTIRCKVYELKEDDYFSQTKYMDSFMTSPAQISYVKGTLRIFTPMTVGRKQFRKYRIAAAVHDSLERYQAEHRRRLSLLFDPPVAVFVVRHAAIISRVMFDNDNNEDSAIINELFSFLGMSDDVTNMRLYSNAVKEVGNDGKEGVEIIVTPLQNAPEIVKEELLSAS